MYSKFLIFNIFLIIFFFKLSQINTKKTTKKLPKYTTLLTKPKLYQKIYTSANSKLKLTTKLTIKHDEPFSKCYSYVETKSNNLKNYSNQISCNTDCNVVKKTTNKNLVEYYAGCCETSCIGAYFRVKNNFTIKFDCCDRNNCNDLKALHSLEYKCEFNKSIPSFSSLVYPVENTKAAGIKMCYLCKDCIYPTRNVEIEYCGKKNNNLNQTFAYQYIYGHSMQEKFWSGGCIPIEDFYLSSHRDLNVKVFSCQTDLCNTPQDKIYRIENAVLCENGWYL